MYYFKGNTVRKRFDEFNNGIEHFRKMQSGEVKLEVVKKLQNIFKSNLNEKSRGRNKSKKQKMVSENIKFLYLSRQAFTKWFVDYSSIVSDAKYKTIQGKGIPSMLARVAWLARVAIVSDNSNLKIFSPKQML